MGPSESPPESPSENPPEVRQKPVRSPSEARQKPDRSPCEPRPSATSTSPSTLSWSTPHAFGIFTSSLPSVLQLERSDGPTLSVADTPNQPSIHSIHVIHSIHSIHSIHPPWGPRAPQITALGRGRLLAEARRVAAPSILQRGAGARRCGWLVGIWVRS